MDTTSNEYSRWTKHLGAFAGVLSLVMLSFHITVLTVGEGAVDVWALLIHTFASVRTGGFADALT